jgi:uncharacterized protein YdeI (YjbR/CyaY-like superfamily)
VEEALCFGWIDSIIKSIDGACYAQKFTPRKARSHWSNLNIQRAQKLIASGKMTEDGLQAFKPERQRAAPAAASELPDELEHHFRVNVTAWEHFSRFPAFYRRMTIQWVASAKKDTTRRKRLAQLIEFSARNERIKFM